MSPDRIGGHPLNPQSWNRYAYTLNNPLKHIDPDGNLTIVTHGTFAANSPDFRPGGAFFEHLRAASPDRTFAYFKWSGNDSREARESAARAMASFIPPL